MPGRRKYYVYIMTNKWNSVLYTGVTSDLGRRAEVHRSGSAEGFASKYRAKKLVFFETYEDPLAAIAREKQIKAGSSLKKLEPIRGASPGWRDLSGDLLP